MMRKRYKDFTPEEKARKNVICRRYREKQKIPCPKCKVPMTPKAVLCRKCRVGVEHHLWKGGRNKTVYGYIYTKMPNHARAGKSGRVLEHIAVWTQANGDLPEGWHVHHINGIRSDNRLINLVALPPNVHHHASLFRTLLKKSRQRICELEAEITALKNKLC